MFSREVHSSHDFCAAALLTVWSKGSAARALCSLSANIDAIWIGNSWIRVIISSIVFCSNALQCTKSLYLGVSGWGLTVSGRCLGVYRCRQKQLNNSRNINLLLFSPSALWTAKKAKNRQKWQNLIWSEGTPNLTWGYGFLGKTSPNGPYQKIFGWPVSCS